MIVPVGAGSLLLGLDFGFRELLRAGQIARLPRLYAAQPLNCSPVAASFAAGVDTPVAREVSPSVAEGAAIRAPLRLREMIGTLRESGGEALALTEDGDRRRAARLCGAGAVRGADLRAGRRRADPARSGGTHRRRASASAVVLSGSGLKASAKVAELCADG